MLMGDGDIRKAMEDGDLVISNFSDGCLEGASYDMRIGKEILVSNKEKVIDPEAEGPVRLEPGEFALLTTLEHIKLKPYIAGNIGAKTYFTRKGLILLSGLQIDPGFDAVLALAVYNASPKSIVLEYGEKICTTQFFRLPAPVTKVFDVSRAKELHEGHLPRVEKNYFRDLEAQSLTEVQGELRQLIRNVSSLGDNIETMRQRMESGFQELRRVMYTFVIPLCLAVIGVVIAVAVSS